MRGDVAGSISQVVESVEIANMFVLVRTLTAEAGTVEHNNSLAGLDLVGHCGSQSSALSGQSTRSSGNPGDL